MFIFFNYRFKFEGINYKFSILKKNKKYIINLYKYIINI